jgi:large subunit ribosomal protein L13
MKTKTPAKSDLKRDWYLIDAQDKILGRLATEIALLLMGKNKPYFVANLDCGDYVVVINAGKVRVSGRKSQQKIYYRHSGYPGGFRETPYYKQLQKDPRKIIEHAVAGMLPKNKLQKPRLYRLKVFVDEKHPYEDRIKK